MSNAFNESYEWHELHPWQNPDDPMYAHVDDTEQQETWGWSWAPQILEQSQKPEAA